MKRFGSICVLFLLALTLSGCDGAGPASTRVWIDVPFDGAELEAGTIPVQSHAASREGIARVELWVNGALYRSDENPTPDEPVIYVVQPWVPTAPGDYTLEVRAYSTDDTASDPASVTVRVTGEVVDVTETPTAEFLTPTSAPSTDTPTPPTDTPIPPTDTPIPPPHTPIPPTGTPQPQISFWVDNATLQAGSCTTVHWETANVKAVYFDGQGVVGTGTYQTCPCSSETHTLDVLLLNNEHDIRTVDIAVTGSCVTPSPTPDTVPPPAPALQSPEDGWEGDCAIDQVDLTWRAVSDPSGVTAYKVGVEYDNAGYWVLYGTLGSTTTSAALQPVPPDTSFCPRASYRHFRWRVRAIDGAGNQGNWSDWFYFSLYVRVD